MGHCKDCHYWEQGTDRYGKKYVYGYCDRVAWMDRFDKVPDDGFVIHADASDDTGLDAGLKTGPMFGCTQFKARD